MKAMIFAAGLGTRLKPLTDAMPKALVPIDGKPLLQHVLEKLVGAGYDDIVINIHHFADQIERWVAEHSMPGVKVHLSDERKELLETGGGIRHAAGYLQDADNFLIHNVDILSNLNLAEFADSFRGKAMLVVSERETQRYLIFDKEMRLVGWTNIKTGEVRTPFPAVREAFDENYTATINTITMQMCPYNKQEGSGPYSLLAFAGIHQMSTELLPLMDRWPDKFSIIDFYLSICREHPIYAYVPDNLRLMDVGKLNTLAAAEEFAKSL